MAYIFGPCTITHNAVDLGKTSAGGSLNIITTERVIDLTDDSTCEPYVKYGIGVIKATELVAGTIGETLILAEYASLILAGKNFTITIPAAKLLWPTRIVFGNNALNTFDIDIFFRLSNNVLLTFATT